MRCLLLVHRETPVFWHILWSDQLYKLKSINMIAKKNPKVDLEGKRTAIFNLGLLVAGSFTLAAFTYTESSTAEKEKLAVAIDELLVFQIEEKVEDKPVVERQEQVRPPDQQQQDQQSLGSQTGLAEVINSTKTGKDGPKISDGPGVFGFSNPPVDLKPIDLGGIIAIPKIDAKYVGGVVAMKEKILSVQEYPEIDKELGNQGTIYISFVVEKDGSVTNITTERGISKTLDREAERIVRSFPKWIPGEDEYGVVRTRVRMPIKFILE